MKVVLWIYWIVAQNPQIKTWKLSVSDKKQKKKPQYELTVIPVPASGLLLSLLRNSFNWPIILPP